MAFDDPVQDSAAMVLVDYDSDADYPQWSATVPRAALREGCSIVQSTLHCGAEENAITLDALNGAAESRIAQAAESNPGSADAERTDDLPAAAQ